MFGMIVLVLISWFLLRFTIREPLSVLGYRPAGLRLQQFAIALLLGILVSSAVHWTESLVTMSSWQVNPGYSWADFGAASWSNFKSVWFEELLFRGALLVLLIHWLGVRWGVVLSSVAFGMYHWFSGGVIGNIPVMIILFATTFIMGLVWAYAYAKSGSMAIAVGSHLGWNGTSSILFSDGPNGEQLLVQVTGISYMPLAGLPSLIFFIASNAALPLILCFWIKYNIATQLKPSQVKSIDSQ
ncbi:lysostaphin resistance A-like protein [Paenibacillus sp. TSA_86.1]|uniref:lysostaphin resistance A-like protein n=1 Tax=Paenibacillus sp. TSA_86.1 TaxID=3415649 RepID=UPI004045DD35